MLHHRKSFVALFFSNPKREHSTTTTKITHRLIHFVGEADVVDDERRVRKEHVYVLDGLEQRIEVLRVGRHENGGRTLSGVDDLDAIDRLRARLHERVLLGQVAQEVHVLVAHRDPFAERVHLQVRVDLGGEAVRVERALAHQPAERHDVELVERGAVLVLFGFEYLKERVDSHRVDGQRERTLRVAAVHARVDVGSRHVEQRRQEQKGEHRGDDDEERATPQRHYRQHCCMH